jgi:hypothetical protein
MKYLLLIVFLLIPYQVDAVWFNSSWSHRVPVEIAPSKVGTTSAIINFPVYLDLKGFPAGFWTKVASTGADVRVVKSDEITETAFELVAGTFSTSSQTGELHFLTNDLSTTSTTTYYVYYGNATATAYAVTDTYGRNNVWRPNYLRVHHGNTPDSTGNTNATLAGTAATTSATVKIGNSAFNFTADTDTTTITLGNITNGYAVSFWARNTESGENYVGYTIDARTGLANGWSYWDTSSARFLAFGGDWSTAYLDSKATTTSGLGGHIFSFDTWHHTVMVPGSTWTDTTVNFGQRYISPLDNFDGWAGQFDELRIASSTTAYNAAYILTQYNNQSSTSTFFYIGPEETDTPPEATTTPSTILQGGGIFGGATIIR